MGTELQGTEVFTEEVAMLLHAWHQNHLQISKQVRAGTAIRQFRNRGFSAITTQEKPVHFDPFPAPTASVVPFLEAIVESAYGIGPQIRSVSIEHLLRTRDVAIQTPEGTIRKHHAAFTELKVTLLYRYNNRIYKGEAFAGDVSGLFLMHTPSELVETAYTAAEHLAAAHAPMAGKMPVVMAPGWCGVWLHEAIGHPLEADVWQHHRLFSPKKDQPIASEWVNVLDDPTLEDERAYFPFDDEGSLASRRYLIKEGRIESLLSERESKKYGNLTPILRARRSSYLQPPMPRMSNVFLASRGFSPEEIISELSTGLFVQTPGKAVFNPHSRMVQVFVKEGFAIKDGKRSTPLTGFWVGGTPNEMLMALEKVGNDFKMERGRGYCEKKRQIVPISVGQPTIRFRSLHVCPTAS